MCASMIIHTKKSVYLFDGCNRCHHKIREKIISRVISIPSSTTYQHIQQINTNLEQEDGSNSRNYTITENRPQVPECGRTVCNARIKMYGVFFIEEGPAWLNATL